jgi:hypothetical protein
LIRENLQRSVEIINHLNRLDREKTKLSERPLGEDNQMVIWIDGDSVMLELTKQEVERFVTVLLEERSFEYNRLLKELETL